jgi:hypothetical protein
MGTFGSARHSRAMPTFLCKSEAPFPRSCSRMGGGPLALQGEGPLPSRVSASVVRRAGRLMGRGVGSLNLERHWGVLMGGAYALRRLQMLRHWKPPTGAGA